MFNLLGVFSFGCLVFFTSNIKSVQWGDILYIYYGSTTSTYFTLINIIIIINIISCKCHLDGVLEAWWGVSSSLYIIIIIRF